MRRGRFITLEGGEGSGKTTQIKKLAAFLEGRGVDVVVTREPGGTPDAEKIRDLLVRRDGGDWSPMTECLLMFASRVQHVETLIMPALAVGKYVISDRFADSSRAYQAYGRGLPLDTVEQINRVSLGDFRPDLTFILDLPVEAGLARSGKRLAAEASAEDKFEGLGLEFHQRLRRGYLDIAAQEPQRCIVIDANRDIEDVAKDLQQQVLEKLPENAL